MSSSVSSVEAPARERLARADVVAAVVVWLGVVLGLVAKFGVGGWGVLVVLLYWPVTIVLPIAGAWVVARPLLGLGRVRKHVGHAPTRYRVLAWVLGLGTLVGYGAMPDGGDDDVARSGLSVLLGPAFAPPWISEVMWWVLVAAFATAAIALVWYAVDRVRLGNPATRLA
ncbi:hypothetical protein [Cellulomonas gelida]|uniref:Uncharacterized protein n=1 Tax=Cellulomonas gelida TaxID=1712 RepID=A0A4Y3KLI5_9CELL|nr:hypothetical protein [Cellulomonas gelida]GEA84743.1 hypothetical protein CGE01nite_19940 [Cellulomonas gelida]GGL28471.1 hypothetical protein GCM10009774_18520 [Cellulomonas gelida]